MSQFRLIMCFLSLTRSQDLEASRKIVLPPKLRHKLHLRDDATAADHPHSCAHNELLVKQLTVEKLHWGSKPFISLHFLSLIFLFAFHPLPLSFPTHTSLWCVAVMDGELFLQQHLSVCSCFLSLSHVGQEQKPSLTVSVSMWESCVWVWYDYD